MWDIHVDRTGFSFVPPGTPAAEDAAVFRQVIVTPDEIKPSSDYEAAPAFRSPVAPSNEPARPSAPAATSSGGGVLVAGGLVVALLLLARGL